MREKLDIRSVTVVGHQFREYAGDPSAVGLPIPMPPDLYLEAGKLVLAIAGADGQISNRERDACLASARLWGMPPEKVEELGRFDPGSASIESLATDRVRGMARLWVFDGIRTARVDGFHEKEEAAAIRAARTLGLEGTIVTAMCGLLDIEDALRQSRHRLLQSPPDLTKHGTGPLIREGAQTRAAEYGNDGGPMPRDFIVKIGKAVLVIAAGDGQLSEPEMRWFLGLAKSAGTPDDVLEEFLDFDAVHGKLGDYVDDKLGPYARGIVFDGIRTARADGYHDKERAMAQRAAKDFGLDPSFVVALENQLSAEDALRSARFRLLTAP